MSKTSNAHFNDGKNMKKCFPQLDSMLKKILGIIGSQIEKDLSLARILI
jgi:hypothetical protein